MSTTDTTTAQQLTDLFSAGTPDTFTTTRAAAADYVSPLLKAGVAMMPLKPDSKHPTTRRGFLDACVDREQWGAWLDKAYKGHAKGTPALGLGIRMGTRIIAADADNPGEVEALQRFLERMGYSADTPPTVTTPGTEDGAHHGGGHWYFSLPEDYALPMGTPGKIGVGEGTERAVLMLGGSYTVAPPTHRNNGIYNLAGVVLPMTPQLQAFIAEQAAERVEKRRETDRRRAEGSGRSPAEQEALEAWRERTGWGSVLTAAGFTETGADRGCGCSEWRRPGKTTSRKSVTAHDCAEHGFYLHVWSDNVEGLEAGESYSLEYSAAALLHAGDMQPIYLEAGLPPKAQGAAPLGLDLQEQLQEGSTGVDLDDPDVPEVPYDEAAYPLGHPNNPRLMERIFNFNPVTRAIYHSARSRAVYTSPMTLLLSELIRAGRYSTQGAHTEIDDQLSMYVALCARSGGGKSVAMSMMQRPSIFLRGGAFLKNQEAASPRGDLVVGGLASGQAMIDGLAEEVLDAGDEDEGRKPEKVLKMRTPAVLTIIEDELDNLAAKSQSGSTLSNTVLSAWSCGTIGDLSRTHGMRMINGVDDPYTVYLVGGIQPARASSMVGRAAVSSGLAQRVFFLATEDPWFDDPVLGKPRPDAAVIDAPADDEDMHWDNDRKQFTLPPIPVSATVGFCEEMHHAMRLQNLHTARGDQDPRDTHLTRIRFRLACLMALHSGQRQVSPEIWEWTSALMEHRRLTLAFVEAGAEAAAQDEADEKGTRAARARVTGDAAVQEDIRDAAALLYKNLPETGAVAWGTWKKRLRSNRRPSFEAALNALVRQGAAVSPDGGKTYQRA
ncbi:bifunctional DNA primase/polymerase [Corynebacterium sp. USCH3]|uniref:bifunctional DNA primase/polymerase n=1 Tax=Corynebacterium sp. USCH3 TaxID=3024840 RepID=UPI0030ABC411